MLATLPNPHHTRAACLPCRPPAPTPATITQQDPRCGALQPLAGGGGGGRWGCERGEQLYPQAHGATLPQPLSGMSRSSEACRHLFSLESGVNKTDLGSDVWVFQSYVEHQLRGISIQETGRPLRENVPQ